MTRCLNKLTSKRLNHRINTDMEKLEDVLFMVSFVHCTRHYGHFVLSVNNIQHFQTINIVYSSSNLIIQDA